MKPSTFFWYELVTSDPTGAADFYTQVVGWKPVPYRPDYTLLQVGGDRGVAGIMKTPAEVTVMPALWMGYLYADDVDAKAREIVAAGGTVKKGPQDIPEIGRFAVATDLHGVPFMIMKPQGEDQPPLPMGTPGAIGWNDLSADDGEEAFAFYSGLFGWTKGEAIPMGEMGAYQLYHAGSDEPAGGVMTKTPGRDAPFWLFYFVVPAIDAARQRVIDAGGTVTMEPMEVPGGAWAMEAVDPQGAKFGLTAATR